MYVYLGADRPVVIVIMTNDKNNDNYSNDNNK